MFADLQRLFGHRLPQRWPEPSRLGDLLPSIATVRSGRRLRFVSAGDEPRSAAEYEASIHATGAVPTRAASWHDTFNALIWALFPQSKATINACHVAELQGSAGRNRSRRRDALTLLDETGLLIASCEPGIECLNRRHRWRELFVDRRDRWWRTIRPFPFGHGLLEQCLDPYLGLTGKAVHVIVPRGFFDLPLSRQYCLLDNMLAGHILATPTPAQLLPLPILGIPGWDVANADPGYYDNRDYFRPQPQR